MFENEIARGGALLDRKGPPNWIDQIDTAQLDLESGTKCILGQLYTRDYESGYVVGLSRLGVTPYEYGFNTPCVNGGRTFQLTAEWRDYIAKQRLMAMAPQIGVAEAHV